MVQQQHRVTPRGEELRLRVVRQPTHGRGTAVDADHGLRPGRLAADRGVEHAVERAPIVGGDGDVGGFGERFTVAFRRSVAQHPPLGSLPGHHARRTHRALGHGHQPLGVTGGLAQPAIPRQRQPLTPAVGLHPHEGRLALADHLHVERAVRAQGHGPQALGEPRLHDGPPQQHLARAAAQLEPHQAVGLALVVDIEERTAVGREQRLVHPDAGRPGHLLHGRQPSVGVAPDHQARRGPGHGGEVPFHPRQPVTGGRPHGLRVEVGALSRDGRPRAARRVDDGEPVRVVLAVDVGDPATVRRDGGRGHLAEARGEALGGAGGQRLTPERVAADEHDPLGGDIEVTAAVPQARAHVHADGEVLGRPAPAHQHAAAAAPLEPDDLACHSAHVP